jgi:plasmid stabilization system protein ParE
MPLRLEIRARARRDLRAIVLYIAEQNGDFVMAERFALRLLDRCSELSVAAGMGSLYQERPSVRKLNEGAYKIIYRVEKTKVIVLRIWDGRRGREPQV